MSEFRYTWPMFNRVFRQAELMERMTARNVNPAIAVRIDQGIAWYDARTKCISCGHERECRNWLESSERCQAAADFCPNLEFFRRCAAIGAPPSIAPHIAA